MRNFSLILSAVMAVGIGGMASAQMQQTEPNNPNSGAVTQDRNTNQDQRTGRGVLGMGGSDADDIRWTIARVTDNALSKDGWDNVLMRLVDADRNRLGDFELSDEQKQKLDGRIDQLQKAFKAKYNEDFRARRNRDYLSSAQVQEGEFGRDAQLAAEVRRNSQSADKTDGTSSGNVTGDRQNQNSGTPRTQNQNSNNPSLTGRPQDRAGNDSGDQNLEDGRNIAVVTLPGIKDKPALRIPMIHELPDSWKINAPDTMTGQKLYDNLLNHLTKVGEMTDQWPATADEAYRAITYHVVIAILDDGKMSSGSTGSNPNLQDGNSGGTGNNSGMNNNPNSPGRP